MPPRLCLLPPEMALALPAARLRLLRRTHPGLTGFDESDPVAVARALSFRPLPAQTAELFHLAAYFATDAGRARIQEAACGRRDLAPWLLLSALDLAIDVVRAANTGDDAALAMQAAALATPDQQLCTRIEYELFGKRCEPAPRLDSIAECARHVHADRFVDAWIAQSDEGFARAVIVHEIRSAPPHPRTGAGSSPPARRRFTCDTVAWDARLGRVSLTLARAATLPDWREKLGAVCAGEPDFFARRGGVDHGVRGGGS